jgi:adhesin transport system membrane fusion protein
MAQSDFAFSNDIRAAVELRTPRTSRMLLMASMGLLATFLLWAHFAVLDEVKRGNGRVVPSRQTQVVQSLEGGIIADLLVQEGAIVDKDQSLARIEDTTFASQFGEIRERRGAMAARVIRLEAETQGLKEVVFPDELNRVAPRAVLTERSVFDSHIKKIAQDIDVIAQQETQKQKEIEELRASETRDAALGSPGHRHARPAGGGAGNHRQDRCGGAGGAFAPAQCRHGVPRPGGG